VRFIRLAAFVFLFTVVSLAQNDRGTITGTVMDPVNASVPGAAIVARNIATGALYETATTVTGNYTLAELPAGVYELSITAAGFAKFTQQGITVQVAETDRIDVVMKLGSATDSVTVTADATLLRTDSADVSHNVTFQRINDLALYQTPSAGVGLRNAYAFMALLPGANFGSSNGDFRVNGLPNDTYSMRIEGQEATYSQMPASPYAAQPAVDGLQEVTMLTSNFSAEYGQAAGGLVNYTVKSGTNQLHGSAFELWKNEDLNAGQPFSNSGNGHLVRPKSRSNDFGGSLGGPVWIPHVYHGRNKTFFFFNIDRMPGHNTSAGTYSTVPTTAMRNGDFSAILTGRNLATDPLGRAIMENTIYDPGTQRVQNGAIVRDPFPGNIIPISEFDPVAAKIQALIPLPTRAGNTNNFDQIIDNPNLQTLLTFKGDENISDRSHVSFYFGAVYQHAPENAGTDGLPFPITGVRQSMVNSPTMRLNFDQTISPTLLFHAGIGFMRGLYMDSSPKQVTGYDAPDGIGLVGGVPNTYNGVSTPETGFPQIQGLSSSFGGMGMTMGVQNANHYYLEKPSAVTSIMKVHSSHTFKAGGEWRAEGQTDRNVRGAQGVYTFSNIETALPSTLGQNLNGGVTGFGYASFLLGAVDGAYVNTPQDPQFRRSMMAAYAQDTWKITRNITLDYGLRYDYQTGLREIHDRMTAFAPTIPNPAVNNLPGGFAYEGTGPGEIGSHYWTKNYPAAWGPRLGLAWQFAPKTVLRAGGGLIYGQTPAAAYLSNTAIIGDPDYNQLLYTTANYGTPALYLRNGLQYTQAQLYPAPGNPGIRPALGQISSPTYWLDPQGGRPPRIISWSVGLEREITKDLAIEAAYVGNRAAWLNANSMNNLNALTPQRIAAAGLSLSNPTDLTLLTSPLNSALAASMGYSTPPYPSFPLTSTVAQSLRPFPQFSTIPVDWSPLGDSWYNSLQSKLTKRTSHGLTGTAAFTWQKELQLGTEGSMNNVFNRGVNRTISGSSQPFTLRIGLDYHVPKLGPNRWTRAATGGWFIGTILRYGSGFPIAAPTATNSLSSVLFQSTFADRVPGVPLFTQNLNCHCFDPNKTFVLNPAAWTQPPAGQFGTAAEYYNDYRYQRRPDEEGNLGRRWQIREGMSLEFRAIFTNIFNRTGMNNPSASNAQATQTMNSAGQTTGGFGYINTGSAGPPRNGTLEMRFQF
jgi:hypothetical protein